MFRLEGLDRFERELLARAQRLAPKELEKELREMAKDVKQKVADKTPVGTMPKPASKRLKRGWKVGRIKRKGNAIYIDVKNKTPHAYIIENGHILVNGRFKPGTHIMENTLREENQNINNRLMQVVRRILR